MTAYWKRLLHNIQHGRKQVVIVSGLPRSGTSMMMQMLDRGGLPILTDHQRTPDEDNPKGYYEFEPVKDLYQAQDKSWVRQGVGKAVKVIAWLLKDLPADYCYNVIFMLRDVDEVIASQNKMLERRGEENPVEDEKLKQNYELHLRKVKYLLEHEPRFRVLYVNHRDCLNDPLGQARRVNAFLGGRLDEAAMAGVVDAQLYRNQK